MKNRLDTSLKHKNRFVNLDTTATRHASIFLPLHMTKPIKFKDMLTQFDIRIRLDFLSESGTFQVGEGGHFGNDSSIPALPKESTESV